jgi:hypothetical protein
MKEELLIDQKKKVIDKIILELSKSDPELYYTDSISVAAIVKEYIQDKNLDRSHYEMVKDMSAHDIQMAMSFNSNCC